MTAENNNDLARLIKGQRWAALATLDNGKPFVSMVAYVSAFDAHDTQGIILNLSRLAVHTRNVLADPRVSLVISQPDNGSGNPQELPRVTINGEISELGKAAAGYSEAKAHYLDRFPDSEPLFQFADFSLFYIKAKEARYVGGFAKTSRYSADQLSSLLTIRTADKQLPEDPAI